MSERMSMFISTGVHVFPSGDNQLEAYLAQPAGPRPLPAVVIIHELWGPNDNIRDIARRCATEGYVALAVDLCAGRTRAICLFTFFRGRVAQPFNHQGIQDLRAAPDYLSQQPGVDAARVGAIGFCMGAASRLHGRVRMIA